MREISVDDLRLLMPVGAELTVEVLSAGAVFSIRPTRRRVVRHHHHVMITEVAEGERMGVKIRCPWEDMQVMADESGEAVEVNRKGEEHPFMRITEIRRND